MDLLLGAWRLSLKAKGLGFGFRSFGVPEAILGVSAELSVAPLEPPGTRLGVYIETEIQVSRFFLIPALMGRIPEKSPHTLFWGRVSPAPRAKAELNKKRKQQGLPSS